MKLIELFEQNVLEYDYGRPDVSHHFWYNPSTGEEIEVPAHDTHTMWVLVNPEKLGPDVKNIIERFKDIAHNFDREYDPELIREIKKTGWVRVVYYGYVRSAELAIAAFKPIDAYRTAKHFANEYSNSNITKISLDIDQSAIHTLLKGNKVDLYLKSGRILEETIKEACKKRKDGKCDQRSKKSENKGRTYGYPFYGLWNPNSNDNSDLSDIGDASASGNFGEVITIPSGPVGTVLTEEKIVQAAFRLPTGEIIPSGALHDWEAIPDSKLQGLSLNDIENGFLTDEGKFLTRQQAAILTKMKKPERQRGALHSYNIAGLGSKRARTLFDPEQVSNELTEYDEKEVKLPDYLIDRYEFWRYSDTLAKKFDEKFGRKDDNPIVNRGLNTFTLDWMLTNQNTPTAYYTEDLPLSPAKLAKIEGYSGEHTYIDNTTHKERISSLAKDMKERGFDSNAPILVHVTKTGPKIVEGNHRVRAAIEAGIRAIPVEWRWLGGTEMNKVHHPVQYVHLKSDPA